jgi:hypothetical protein
MSASSQRQKVIIQVKRAKKDRFPLQLQLAIQPKKDNKLHNVDEPLRKQASRLRVAKDEQRGNPSDRSNQGKEIMRNMRKLRKRRNRGGEESGSVSHEKNSTLTNSKQIKISKDKYSIPSNLSRMMKRSMNELSIGQDKTLKLMWKNKEKFDKEEKKKHLESFNETIRKNNFKSIQIARDSKEQPLISGGPNVPAPALNISLSGNNNKKNLKNFKKKEEDHSQSVHAANQPARGISDVEKSKKIISSIPQGTKLQPEVSSQKKASGIIFKKHVQGLSGNQLCDQLKNSASQTPNLKTENLTKKQNDKSQDERRSTEELKKKTKRALRKKENKKGKESEFGEGEKIKDNLMKLNTKARLALKQQIKMGSRRLNKQRRSKSSNDLFSESLMKKIIGRSDSVNSKLNNEEALYLEYKQFIGKDSKEKEKKGSSHRDTIKDRNGPKAQGIKGGGAVAQGPRPHKLKSSKSSKTHQKNTSFPMKVKRLQGVFDKEPTITENKLRPNNFLDKVLPTSGTRTKNYENIPNLLLLRNKALKKSKKKKNVRPIPLEEEIPMEEQRMIDNEILHPKTTDSDYYFNSLGNKRDKYKRPSGESLGDDKPLNSDDLRAEIALNNAQSPKSVVIRDSESSEKDPSAGGESPVKEALRGEGEKGDPLSQKNLDKWMYLLNEFKKCGKSGYVDEDLKAMLMDFCQQTQKDINTLAHPANSKHSLKSELRLSGLEEEGKARAKKKFNLGIDVEKINEEFNKKAYPVKENRSSSFQWLRAEYEQNVGEISNLLGNHENDTLKKIQVIGG